jgi:hypothetical protein
MKQFDWGANNGSKTSHALADLGNMMLLPKLAKNGESLTPARVGLFHFWTPIKRKLEEWEKHKRRIFSNNGQTKCWDFPPIIFSQDKFLWADPLP